MHSELIEWQVVRTDKGERRVHSEGAQSVFGRTRARKVAKELGPPWRVVNLKNEEPTDEDD